MRLLCSKRKLSLLLWHSLQKMKLLKGSLVELKRLCCDIYMSLTQYMCTYACKYSVVFCFFFSYTYTCICMIRKYMFVECVYMYLVIDSDDLSIQTCTHCLDAFKQLLVSKTFICIIKNVVHCITSFYPIFQNENNVI